MQHSTLQRNETTSMNDSCSKLKCYHTTFLLTKCHNSHHLPLSWCSVNVRLGKGTLSLSAIRPGPFARGAPVYTVGPWIHHIALWSLINVRIYRTFWMNVPDSSLSYACVCTQPHALSVCIRAWALNVWLPRGSSRLLCSDSRGDKKQTHQFLKIS